MPDFGEVIVNGKGSEQREEDLDYIRDFLEDFVGFAESYVPDIVDEFKEHYKGQYSHWLKHGYSIKIGGSC